MCGIAGILNKTDVKLEQSIQKMIDSIRHRGPDDSGKNIFSKSGKQAFNLALGHTRLSIIDISSHGHQPMFNEDKTLWIVYNGELYNFKEIQKELNAKGIQFRSHTDTEVVLKAYEEWGVECLGRFRGMFSFAIWDSKKQELFLARDRLGIKPLYYFQSPSLFIFASEVRAILASRMVDKNLSIEGLHSYLQCGGVRDPLTLIDNVYSLQPGHYIIHNGKGCNIYKYWDLLDTNNKYSGQSLGEVRDCIRYYMEEAVEKHLISDVPIGAFLSGGVDSSGIVALMRKVSNGVIKTVSIVFPEKEFDESKYSQKIAEQFGTEHQEVKLTEMDLLNSLPVALNSMDQPTFDGINTYYVSKYTRQAGLTVALSGLGGDELFGGYPSFNRVPKIENMLKVWASLPQGMKHFITELYSKTAAVNPRSSKILSILNGDIKRNESYLLLRCLFTKPEIMNLISGSSSYAWQLPEIKNKKDSFNLVSYLEMTNYMSNILLRDTDFMSMASSLEVRVPFIDHEIVEYVFSIPGRLKKYGKTPKSLFVSSMPELPRSIIERKKMGFTFPLEVWMRQELKEKVEKVLLDSSIVGIPENVLNENEVKQIWSRFKDGKTSWHRPWSLFVLKNWCRNNLQ